MPPRLWLEASAARRHYVSLVSGLVQVIPLRQWMQALGPREKAALHRNTPQVPHPWKCYARQTLGNAVYPFYPARFPFAV